MNNNKRYGCDISQFALNNYLNEQVQLYNHKGNLTLKEYGSSIFSNPLN